MISSNGMKALCVIAALSSTTAFQPYQHAHRSTGVQFASAKSDPVTQDALERTAAHLEKLKGQGTRRPPSNEDAPPDPLGEERERIYRQYLQLSANALKDELKERKMPRTGRKPDLAMRLAEEDLKEAYGFDAKEPEELDAKAVLTGDPDVLVDSNKPAGRVNQFAGLVLSEAAGEALGRAGFHQPSPIQAATIGPIADGKSVILHAMTGSGKTLAYVLPITEQLWDGTTSFSVIMTPTRELAAQVAGIASVLAPPGSVRLVSRPTNLMSDGVKDRGERPEGGRYELENARPRLFVGSAKAIMQSLYGDGKMPAPPTSKPEAMAFLQNVRYLVMDEVDRLLGVKKSRGDKQHKKIHEKPAAVVCSAVARLSLGKAQVVSASATVGRPLRREVARVLGLTAQECPPVIRGAEEDEQQQQQVAQEEGVHQTRAVTIPDTVQNYVMSVDGSSPGKLLTAAYEVVQALDASKPKRVLLVLARGFGISTGNAIGSMKHFGGEPKPQSLLDALEADGTDQMMEVHREVSGAGGVGQSSYFGGSDSTEGYFFVTGEDTVRGLHLDGLDYVLVAGKPNGPDEYTHIAGRTGRAGRSGKVISILSDTDATSLVSWEKMLNVDFIRLSKADAASLSD